jgi:hypothetical protein
MDLRRSLPCCFTVDLSCGGASVAVDVGLRWRRCETFYDDLCVPVPRWGFYLESALLFSSVGLLHWRCYFDGAIALVALALLLRWFDGIIALIVTVVKSNDIDNLT